MELSKQVTSLEISKRLNELKVKQDSLFYWSIKEDGMYNNFLLIRQDEKNDKFYDGYYSAFTVSELGEMLPEFCLSGKTEDSHYNCWKFDNMCLREIEFYNNFQTYTEADARGNMLIYLLENNLLEIK